MTAAFRSPYAVTARDAAAALIGTQRAKQTVHVSSRTYHEGRLDRAVVLVVPHGAETGEYYEIHSERTLDALQRGATPAYLELEPYDPRPDLIEYADEDRACNAADRAIREAKEAI